jgi:hypothetical protein
MAGMTFEPRARPLRRAASVGVTASALSTASTMADHRMPVRSPCRWKNRRVCPGVGEHGHAGRIRPALGHADQHRHQQLAQAFIPGGVLHQQTDDAAHQKPST